MNVGNHRTQFKLGAKMREFILIVAIIFNIFVYFNRFEDITDLISPPNEKNISPIPVTQNSVRIKSIPEINDESIPTERKTKRKTSEINDGSIPTETAVAKGVVKIKPLSETGIGACLLVKDDNDKLVEWLAYHYHVLPLRNLMVAVDPTSNTSPETVFEKWREMGMRIDVLSDEDFMPKGEELEEKLSRHLPDKMLEKRGDRQIGKKVRKNNLSLDDEMKETVRIFQMHRVRQREFLRKCLLDFKDRRFTWTIAIDTDEYIAFNRPDKDENEDTSFKVDENDPFHILDEDRLKSIADKRQELPLQFGGKGNTVADLILSMGPSASPWSDEACMSLPRLFFGSVTSRKREINSEHKDSISINARSFDTMRYRTHATKGSFQHNLYGKSMVDVSRVARSQIKALTKPKSSVHWPVKYCKRARPFRAGDNKGYAGKKPPKITPISATLLRIHHYLGSWESYNARDDPRRSKELYKEVGNVNGGTDDDIRSWLSSFVDEVGWEKSQDLLSKQL